MSESNHSAARLASSGRWLQLWLGVVCMVLIANLQYAWTLFVDPMHQAHGWSLAEIQWAFSIFIATETWLTPVAGTIVDRLGPRAGPGLSIAAGGVLVGIGWLINAYADSLGLLYIGAAISGTGAGAIYATCVGNAVKWFPDRRGLAVGLTAAGFGAGAAMTVIPIRLTISAAGYAPAFFWFGIGQGLILIVISRFCAPRQPLVPATVPVPPATDDAQLHQRGDAAVAGVLADVRHVRWGFRQRPDGNRPARADRQGFRHLQHRDLFGATTLSVALVVDNVLNGLARPFFGGLSDRIGRETTMGLAFTLGAISYWLLAIGGQHPVGVRAVRRVDLLHLGRDFLAVSRPPAPTRLARNTPPPTPACFTPPRGHRPFWCRSQTC